MIRIPTTLRSLLLFLLVLSVYGCQEETTRDVLFLDRPSSETGIEFRNDLVIDTSFNILNYIYFYNGAGVAAADLNGDGWQDLYFTSNQGADALYLNKGDWNFERIDRRSGVDNATGWTSGISVVDINADGLLDIYICKLHGHLDVTGQNLLYVNQGNDADGYPMFEEKASEYGLDFKGYATQAAFLDYDLDGDLDMFLLNHSTNPNQNYGKGSRRSIPDARSGDKLFANNNGHFVDVSEEAGIFQSKFGYGLGVAVSDLNNDGYPDIYISNDFYENDYLYMNNGQGGFREVIHDSDAVIGHTSHFSMGNDIADINNDGWNDIISLDMLPEDLVTYKSSGMEFSYPIYTNYIRNGYAHQYMQNSLQINNHGKAFSELGYLAGIAATEWSWSPLIADYDLDGRSDVFITNGIPGATNDMDFISFIANEEIQRSLSKGVSQRDLDFIGKIPEKKVANYFYRNLNGVEFADATADWSTAEPTFSNGGVRVDLDNDGDLDLVVNNLNAEATVQENSVSAKFPERNWLKVQLKGDDLNPMAVGSRVTVYQGEAQQSRELYPTRGYLSTQPYVLHFGLGASVIDSLTIAWPDGREQTVNKPEVNSVLLLSYLDSQPPRIAEVDELDSPMVRIDSVLSHTHVDNVSLEFNRDPLVPYALSNQGPAMAVADVNGDGLEDLFLGGGKGQPASLWLQSTSGEFDRVQTEVFEIDKLAEDTAAAFFDADQDGDADLLVAAGGNEFKTGEAIRPRLYINTDGQFQRDSTQFEGVYLNAATVNPEDIDGDGDVDLLLTADTTPTVFGSDPRHFLFLNEGNATFSDVTAERAPGLLDHGSITAAEWGDMDGDGDSDLVVSGLWSAVTVYSNNTGNFVKQEENGLDHTAGWWSAIRLDDMDGDGDMDIIAGNWGLNSRLTASRSNPLRLYRSDFDDNGKEEPIVTYYYRDEETVIVSKDELVKQLPGLNKSFLSYGDFARASVEDLFGRENLESASQKEVYELASIYFEQDAGQFTPHQLPLAAQYSSVNDILVRDFDADGIKDLFLVGNNFEISTQLSRLDASQGVLLMGTKSGEFRQLTNPFFTVSGAARSLAVLNYLGKPHVVVARNNQQPAFLRLDN